MALVTLKNIFRPIRCSQLIPIFSKHYSLYEPDYLKALEPKFPIYPTINIQIKGYDYPIVEKFHGFIYKLAERMDIDADDSYAMPPKELLIKLFKPKMGTLSTEYNLNVYERNIQISNSTSINLPILIRVIEASLPMGIMLNVKNFDPEEELRRYIPDKKLLDLKDILKTEMNVK